MIFKDSISGFYVLKLLNNPNLTFFSYLTYFFELSLPRINQIDYNHPY